MPSEGSVPAGGEGSATSRCVTCEGQVRGAEPPQEPEPPVEARGGGGVQHTFAGQGVLRGGREGGSA